MSVNIVIHVVDIYLYTTKQQHTPTAVASPRQQDRDGDHEPGGAEPHAAAAGPAPGVQRRPPQDRQPSAEEHRQK